MIAKRRGFQWEMPAAEAAGALRPAATGPKLTVQSAERPRHLAKPSAFAEGFSPPGSLCRALRNRRFQEGVSVEASSDGVVAADQDLAIVAFTICQPVAG